MDTRRRFLGRVAVGLGVLLTGSRAAIAALTGRAGARPSFPYLWDEAPDRAVILYEGGVVIRVGRAAGPVYLVEPVAWLRHSWVKTGRRYLDLWVDEITWGHLAAECAGRVGPLPGYDSRQGIHVVNGVDDGIRYA